MVIVPLVLGDGAEKAIFVWSESHLLPRSNEDSIGALETETMRVYDKLRRDLENKKKSAAGNPTAPPT